MAKHRRQAGFTLVEILITLALVTMLSVVALNVLAPWLTFKQSLDTDRKLQDMRQALQTAYAANAMAIEENPGRVLLGLNHDVAVAGSACGGADGDANLAALGTAPLSTYLTEAGRVATRDGTANPLCFFISPQLTRDVEGVRIYFHMLAVVSTGQNGTLDVGTTFDAATGQLTFADGSDDRGVVVNGFAVQYAKYRDTLERMNRLASLYESYFTTRFLNTADRDVSRNYFYSNGSGGDTGGSIPATGGWTSAQSVFGSVLGVSPADAASSYEATPTANNSIEVGNNQESVTANGFTTTVRSPATLGTGSTPPYTALLRARIPGAGNYLVRAVVGNY
jgi:prepilin-type N-terminal cleavage/methylation domain-containing protein